MKIDELKCAIVGQDGEFDVTSMPQSACAALADSSKVESFGEFSAACATGQFATARVFGLRSVAVAVGAFAKASARGVKSLAVAIADGSKAIASEHTSLAIAAGKQTCAGAEFPGAWLVFIRWDLDKPIHFFKVDGVRVKTGILYRLSDAGKLVAVREFPPWWVEKPKQQTTKQQTTKQKTKMKTK
jgi:hypothetical protein